VALKPECHKETCLALLMVLIMTEVMAIYGKKRSESIPR
jgi:F0F1-type ATP synthase membrane subunit c/vacuolar-type H+-ATPase subunit K